MKSAFKINETQPTFKPVTLTFVCETEEELINIWLRLNVHRSNIIESSNSAYAAFSKEQTIRALAFDTSGNTKAWNTVNNAIIETGMSRRRM